MQINLSLCVYHAIVVIGNSVSFQTEYDRYTKQDDFNLTDLHTTTTSRSHRVSEPRRHDFTHQTNRRALVGWTGWARRRRRSKVTLERGVDARKNHWCCGGFVLVTTRRERRDDDDDRVGVDGWSDAGVERVDRGVDVAVAD